MKHTSRLGKIVRTVLYFLRWGIFWGALLGALAGTLIFPVWGTLLSTGWGLGSGAASGIAAALLVVCLYPMQPAPEQAMYQRRRLTLVVGMMTALGTPPLILLTSYDFIWRSLISNYAGFGYWLLIPALCAAGIFGGLAAASTASRYADKSEGMLDRLDGFGNVVSSARYFAIHAANRWVFLISATCVAFYFRDSFWQAAAPGAFRNMDERYRIFIENFIVGLIGTGIVIGLLSLAIGALIGFLNRIYFVEYKAHWTMERYRIAVMVIAGVGILGMAAFWLIQVILIRWVGVMGGIVMVALYAAYLARGYAEHFYEGLDKPKRKGKPKNEDALELGQDMA
jgi:hypothetical protein